MEIINYRIVCSSCKQPFEVGQQYTVRRKKPVLLGSFWFIYFVCAKTTKSEGIENVDIFAEIFHKGCD